MTVATRLGDLREDASLVAPKILKPIGRQLRITHSVLDLLAPHLGLDDPYIMSNVGYKA